MNGFPAPVVSQLLGHSNVRMTLICTIYPHFSVATNTLRYAHLADNEIEAAAVRIGAAIVRVMTNDQVIPCC